MTYNLLTHSFTLLAVSKPLLRDVVVLSTVQDVILRTHLRECGLSGVSFFSSSILPFSCTSLYSLMWLRGYAPILDHLSLDHPNLRGDMRFWCQMLFDLTRTPTSFLRYLVHSKLNQCFSRLPRMTASENIKSSELHHPCLKASGSSFRTSPTASSE